MRYSVEYKSLGWRDRNINFSGIEEIMLEEDIIKEVLFERTDIPEWGINRLIEEMKKRQDKRDGHFEDFIDRIL